MIPANLEAYLSPPPQFNMYLIIMEEIQLMQVNL